MGLFISSAVRKKLLLKHNVNESEVIECFANREKSFLKDTREDHDTDPPTLWFVAETDFGRKLKIAFMHHASENKYTIKTAYPANSDEIRIYNKYA
jgi:hypothetical protein